MSVLVGGASTQSRCRRPLPEGWSAQVIRRGAVSELWQVTAGGKAFKHGINVTWIFDQAGPVLGYTSALSHRTRPLLARVERLVARDGMYGPGSVVSALEVRAAELLCQTVAPHLTDGEGTLAMRWFANGSDACDAAVRVARAATGRTHFISIGYHGASAIFAHPPQNAGVPEGCTAERTDIEFGDTQALLKALKANNVACVIVEVPSTDEDAKSFLQAVAKACDKADAVFILDEVVTGFRLALGGAAEVYGVRPDLACYGKAMSNGRPISALVGWPKVVGLLADQVFYSTTFGGDPLHCAFVVATVEYLAKHALEVYGHIWKLGDVFKAGLASVGVRAIGHAPRSTLSFEREELRRQFCAEMVRRGIVMDRPNYVTLGHMHMHVDQTVETAEKALRATRREGIETREDQ